MENNKQGMIFYKILNGSLQDFSCKVNPGLNDFGSDGCQLYYEGNVLQQPIVPPQPVIAKFFIDKKYLGKKYYQKYDAGYVVAKMAELVEYHSFSDPETLDWIIREKIYISNSSTALEKYINNSNLERYIIPEIKLEITKDICLSLIRFNQIKAMEKLFKERRSILSQYKTEMFETAIAYRNKTVLEMILDEWDMTYVISEEKLESFKITNQNIIDLLNENGFNCEVYERTFC